MKGEGGEENGRSFFPPPHPQQSCPLVIVSTAAVNRLLGIKLWCGRGDDEINDP